MPISHILLSVMLATNPAYQDTLVDLTGDNIKEKIVFHQDSSFCRILKFNPEDSTYVKIKEYKLFLEKGENYGLFIKDFNEDGIKDFTIYYTNTDIPSYFLRWDKKKKNVVLDSLLIEE